MHVPEAGGDAFEHQIGPLFRPGWSFAEDSPATQDDTPLKGDRLLRLRTGPESASGPTTISSTLET